LPRGKSKSSARGTTWACHQSLEAFVRSLAQLFFAPRTPIFAKLEFLILNQNGELPLAQWSGLDLFFLFSPPTPANFCEVADRHLAELNEPIHTFLARNFWRRPSGQQSPAFSGGGGRHRCTKSH
jgi:hypothetical protein